jgi:hypothetical protein
VNTSKEKSLCHLVLVNFIDLLIDFVLEPFHFSTTQGDMIDTPHIPQGQGISLE